MYKKGPFSGGYRPTTWIELDLFPNKVAGVVYIYQRCLIFTTSSTASS